MIEDANPDDTQNTEVSAYEQFEVRVLEGNRLIQPEACPFCAGDHLFKVTGDQPITISFVNTDPFGRHGVFTLNGLFRDVARVSVAPGDTYTLTADQIDQVIHTISPMKVLGSLKVSVRWANQPLTAQKLSSEMAKAIDAYLSYFGVEPEGRSRAIEGTESAFREVFTRSTRQIFDIVVVNEATLENAKKRMVGFNESPTFLIVEGLSSFFDGSRLRRSGTSLLDFFRRPDA